MEPTVRLRSRTSRALGAFMVLVAAAGLASVLLDDLDAALRWAAPTVLFGVLGWAAFWQPYVEVSEGGVTVANTLRTVTLPWPAIEEVDGRYGLRLRTAYGSFTAWAAQAPAGRDRAREVDSETARLVRERLAALRAAGHLDDPRLERARPEVAWHREVVAALVLLAVATVLLPLAA